MTYNIIRVCDTAHTQTINSEEETTFNTMRRKFQYVVIYNLNPSTVLNQFQMWREKQNLSFVTISVIAVPDLQNSTKPAEDYSNYLNILSATLDWRIEIWPQHK